MQRALGCLVDVSERLSTQQSALFDAMTEALPRNWQGTDTQGGETAHHQHQNAQALPASASCYVVVMCLLLPRVLLGYRSTEYSTAIQHVLGAAALPGENAVQRRTPRPENPTSTA